MISGSFEQCSLARRRSQRPGGVTRRAGAQGKSWGISNRRHRNGILESAVLPASLGVTAGGYLFPPRRSARERIGGRDRRWVRTNAAQAVSRTDSALRPTVHLYTRMGGMLINSSETSGFPKTGVASSATRSRS